MRVEFTVPGVPQSQGSKVRNRYGGIREANTGLRPWRDAVAWEARAAMNGALPLIGPQELVVVFRFPRPKSHYGTGRNQGTLKRSAPLFHSVAPDVDKLARAVCDSLTGVVVRDDSQFARVVATKAYGTPGAVVVVTDENLEAAAGPGP